MTPYQFSDAVRVYCALVGGSVSSWGRTWFHNLAVEGVRDSAHQYWLGGDVRTWEHLTPAERQRVRAALGKPDFEYPTPALVRRLEIAERLGLRMIVEDDHDHLQPIDWRAG